MDSDSGVSYNGSEGDEDIYYDQISPILLIFWRSGIEDLTSYSERYQKFLYKLSELFLLQHYWNQSDVLVNLSDALGDSSTIEENTTGENILDFYNIAKHDLRSYIIKFLNHHA